MKDYKEGDLQKLEQRLADCPQDFENTLELAWCYAQLNRMDEAVALVRQLDRESVRLYGSQAQDSLEAEQPQEALEHLNRAVSLMESTQIWEMDLLEQKVQVLRELGQAEEALTLVQEMMDRHDYEAGFQVKFEICCQFELWDRASTVVAAWKNARRNDPAQKAAAAQLRQQTKIAKTFQKKS